jgi:hypothetical protein
MMIKFDKQEGKEPQMPDLQTTINYDYKKWPIIYLQIPH